LDLRLSFQILAASRQATLGILNDMATRRSAALREDPSLLQKHGPIDGDDLGDYRRPSHLLILLTWDVL